MARLSYDELRARLRLSTGRRGSARPSDHVGTVPMFLREDEVDLILRRTVPFRMADPVEQELTRV